MDTISWKKYALLIVVIAASMLFNNSSFSLNAIADTDDHAVSTDTNKQLTRRGYRSSKQSLITNTGHVNQTSRTSRSKNRSAKQPLLAITGHNIIASRAGRIRNR